MSNRKYLFERPEIENSISDKLMDFDEILVRTNRTRQYKFALKSLGLVFLLAVGILSFTYLVKQWPVSIDQKSDLAIGRKEDNLTTKDGLETIISEKKKTDPIVVGSEKKENDKPLEKRQTDSLVNKAKEGKHYKIQETHPQKNTFVQAAPEEGYQNLYLYFNENLPFPDSLRLKENEGKVIVEFTVKTDGEIENVRVVQSLHPVLDSIATACVKNMPSWIPAKINNEPIETKHSIPLIFQLENN